MVERWSLKWPTESGLYLFFGGREGETTKFHLVQVVNNDGNVSYLGGAEFLYWSEQVGAWRPFDEKPPDLEALRECE